MLVKALIRSVTRQGSVEKPFAVLAIETEQPLEIIEIRMFKNAIDDGTVARLENVEGRTIDLPLRMEVYQGRLQYQLPYGADIQCPPAKMAKTG